MIELLESLILVVLLVPVVMAIILGSIYGLGELFNLISTLGKPKGRHDEQDAKKTGLDVR
ncbi:AcrZ family multidrug efflux pump-associated protein [Acerihabitans sp. TG2]|uniref:AcrZ family multidrug efflux pump-associated protein n=1 Tax=Acerihabitans sp. TG2 TaxID=3096008 RepID=UPI002B236014|nr:AcrZ family multidrug efflux pump-associated protein [Acerihabitans sp. TG2]MEA9390533.1 AcrZ family multidrug efflux pump-associated protein [Acerihabitans sp. TG2]